LGEERILQDGAPHPASVTWEQVFNEIAELREEIQRFKETKNSGGQLVDPKAGTLV